jgi:RND family efflux transporter MFP subunit
MLERHTLRAPFPGVVSRRMVDPGEWVTPGTGVMGLVDLDRIRADFSVAQQHFPSVTRDSGVRVRLDALPERRFPARIVAVVPVNSPDARTFTVRTVLEDTGDAAITPGMSARATLSVDTGRESVTVPRDALLRHPDGRVTVWVVPDGQTEASVTERQVEPGLTFGNRVEIRSGLKPGERVVTRGNEALQPEQTVRITDGAGS